MTEESYIIVYTMFLSQKLNEKWVRKMKWKQYIIVYTMILSQKMSKKNELKNDWRIVYI